MRGAPRHNLPEGGDTIMGRPRSEKEALRSKVCGAVNRQEREAIEEIARRTGRSVSDLVRQGVRVLLTATAAGADQSERT